MAHSVCRIPRAFCLVAIYVNGPGAHPAALAARLRQRSSPRRRHSPDPCFPQTRFRIFSLGVHHSKQPRSLQIAYCPEAPARLHARPNFSSTGNGVGSDSCAIFSVFTLFSSQA